MAGEEPTTAPPAGAPTSWICSPAARMLGTAMNVLGLVVALAAAYYAGKDEVDQPSVGVVVEGGSDWWYAIVAAGVLVAVAGIGLLWYCFASPSGGSGVGAALLGLTSLILSVAAGVTVIVYVLPVSERREWTDWVNFVAPAAGILAAVGVAAAFAAWDRDRSTPDRANPGLHGDLARRWERLNAQVTALCDAGSGDASPATGQALSRATACQEARAQRDFVGEALNAQRKSRDVRWVLGTGYVDLLRRMHDAEEALYLVDSDQAVVRWGLHDEMRLKDSNFPNEDDLLNRLRTAVFSLGGAVYITKEWTPPQLGSDCQAAAANLVARGVLGDVRHALNEFRDGRREGLVRARNHLTAVGTLTGLAAYALLALAVLVGAPSAAIIAATAFYLIGAVVGLFDQLRLSSGGQAETEEDFGLGRARLLYAPVLSGLAAVGGVLVTAMLYAQLSGSFLAYPRTVVGGGTPVPGDVGGEGAAPEVAVLVPPPVADIFDLDANRFGLVIAAIFGLTPSLLINRLQGQADQIKSDLQSTNAEGTTAGG